MKNLEKNLFTSRLQKIAVAILCLIFVLTNSTNIYSQTVSIDETFGQNGIVKMPDMGGVEFLTSDEHGNIFAFGYSRSGCPTILKTDANGIIDENFGTNGTVILSDYGSNMGSRYGIKITNDNKIVIVFLVLIHTYGGGHGGEPDPEPQNIIMRLNEDGSIDEDFGIDGKIILVRDYGVISNSISTVYVENDDFMFIAGIDEYPDPNSIWAIQKPYISKYNYNGEIDTSFGNDGKVYLINDYDSKVYPVCIKILRDGSIIAAGQQSGVNNSILCKINSTGNFSTDFANNGFFTRNFANNGYAESFYDIIEESTGKLLLAVGITENGPSYRHVVCELNSTGTINSNFGENGIFYCDSEGWNFTYRPVILQNGNKYLIGRIKKIASINNNGTLDTYFNNTGLFVMENNTIKNMKQQTPNKFIVEGTEGIIRLIISSETSIKPNNLSNLILAFPNPVNETLYFSNETIFEITDIQGKVLLRSEQPVNSVSVSTLSIGVYFVKVGNHVQKIIKE